MKTVFVLRTCTYYGDGNALRKEWRDWGIFSTKEQAMAAVNENDIESMYRTDVLYVEVPLDVIHEF